MLTKTELAGMQDTQTGHMMDECVIMTRSATTDAYGTAVELFTDSETVACGFGYVGSYPTSSEALQSSDVPISNHPTRLPLGTQITSLDRVRITKRFGVDEAEPKTYHVIGPIQSGPSGLVVRLELVSDL